jgi:3-oxoacid CoA-transferase subunit A
MTTPMRAVGRHIPLRRTGPPDEASYFTGASLDGGWATALCPAPPFAPRPASGRKDPHVNKVSASAAEAVADICDGASLAVGGFGLSGIPAALIDALHAQGATGLKVVSNNCGVDGQGLGLLLTDGRVSRVTGSYVGENKEFARQYLSGELEVELVPQGTLAERLRAGGAGIPAFYTPAGVGTQVADGGLPWRYAADGSIALASPSKEKRSFGGRAHVLEHSITTDFALVHAWRGDTHGNLVFNKASANFNPLAAMAGRITIAEVEELVEPGELSPDAIHLPGVFVQRVVALTPAQAADKPIERRTISAPQARETVHS